MEAVPTAHGDSVNANPSSVKSEDSSPRPDSGRGSPPPNCAICLGTCKNKSFTDSCLHQFCFSCLLTWSKVKAECPLCKQIFKSIIHNVQSNDQYDQYMVEQRTEETVEIDNMSSSTTRRFRYRTTLTLPRRDSLAIQQLLLLADVFPPPAPRAPPARRRRSQASFRRTVYRHNLWARPLPDFTGRFRDCSPEFYRYNNAQMHRLVPWLSRELHYLLNENIPHISYVLTRILELLPQYHINSTEFREALHRYFGDRTEHFLHELYCFASTPYDMTGYDRNVQYTTDLRISTMVNEVISSSDSDASVDSDIVMVSSSEPAAPPAPSAAAAPGPSRPTLPVYPRTYIPNPNDSVIPIETISHSDTDDDSSEVMVVGYIKPPQERTPEVVDLLGSDSDVVVQDNPQPGPSQLTELQPPEPRPDTNVPLVKLSLKRHVPPSNGDSDTSDDYFRPKPTHKRRKTNDSDMSWHANESPEDANVNLNWSTSSDLSLTSSSSSSSTSSVSFSSSTDTDSSNSTRRRAKVSKKKSKKKSSKTSTKTSSQDERKKSRSKSHKQRKQKKKRSQKKEKKSKGKKSANGKDVKSSKKSSSRKETHSTHEQVQPEPALDQPSTSAVASASTGAVAITNTSTNTKANKTSKDKVKSKSSHRRRRSQESSKRLKSVVKVINAQQENEPTPSNSNLLNLVSDAILNPNSNVLAYNSDSGSMHSEGRSKRRAVVPPEILEKANSCFGVNSSMTEYRETRCSQSETDSEDNLPLTHTLKRS